MSAKPIRRSKQLQVLSRQHHAGLLFCWKLRQGIRLGIETGRMSRYVDHFWKSELQFHFKEEERLLFTDPSDPFVSQAKKEHSLLKTQIEQIIVSGDRTTQMQLDTIAENLDDHIRFEERILFPHLEVTLTKEKMESIGKSLLSGNGKIYLEDYADEFWKDGRASL
jgi:hypothetical protein